MFATGDNCDNSQYPSSFRLVKYPAVRLDETSTALRNVVIPILDSRSWISRTPRHEKMKQICKLFLTSLENHGRYTHLSLFACLILTSSSCVRLATAFQYTFVCYCVLPYSCSLSHPSSRFCLHPDSRMSLYTFTAIEENNHCQIKTLVSTGTTVPIPPPYVAFISSTQLTRLSMTTDDEALVLARKSMSQAFTEGAKDGLGEA
ncbi:hypothetical protein G7K_5754-t1 [Saitoella complicata NRRL Y-17804]|uniref:Uncharacterized protein n=1 Tax=Saitoella complicata (strain BCRC 22490 / CBS 7301 / JCM 7358 / NBRC 10748 / NRRL Y-17804) TaxID=698492 RepID=A0A0E9NPQ2_SAICN|nr:hypothetical protein G7K_5754-t1 [Saitoella complicata NRRL Y-17804]